MERIRTLVIVTALIAGCSTPAGSDGDASTTPDGSSRDGAPSADARSDARLDAAPLDAHVIDATMSDAASDVGADTSSSDASTADMGIACSVPSDCPATGSACVVATCNASICGTSFVAAGTATTTQTPNDCHQQRCDGAGNVTNAIDDADLPIDNNACAIPTCTSGVPSYPPRASGTTCGTGAGQVCDGSGACVGCVAPASCPGTDDECQTRTCVAGVCGFSFTSAGTHTTMQTANDCRVNQCNGAGQIVSAADDSDLPSPPGMCFGAACSMGQPSTPPLASGTACTQGGGTRCNGAGACVQCIAASDCGADTACQMHTCVAGMCGVSNAAAGSVASNPVPGDCRSNQCDGSGGVSANAIDNTDVPLDDGNQCTGEVCVAGTPQHPSAPMGTACSQGGGTRCDGAGACVQCLAASDCGVDTACQTHTCNAGVCGVMNGAAGTVVGNPVPNDCRSNQCDGAGNVVANAVDNTDVPVDDGNQCTSDVCAAGSPQHPPTPGGTSCNQGGGTMCNGAGACVQCLTASTCGTDTACQVHTCNGGTCGVMNAPAGTVVGNPTLGDCRTNQCNGSGVITANAPDSSDVPADDGNQCTSDICVAGSPQHPPTPRGTVCNQGGGAICDGSGNCVQCLMASDCGTSTACRTYTCNAGACGMTNAPAGTFVSDPMPGDCRSTQCNGSGGVDPTAVDDTDLPMNGNQCTAAVCTAGVPSNPALPPGTACGQFGGTECDGMGDCVQCVSASECPPTGNECSVPACNAGLCGASPVPAGTPTATQMAHDCRQMQCDGTGSSFNAVDNTDLPADDGNQCTAEVCSAGTPSHPSQPQGTACNQNGGVLCDGAAAPTCTQTFSVLRVGAIGSSTALAATTTAVFIDTYYPIAATPVVSTVPLPTSASAGNQALTLSGTATSEGGMTRSADGHYLVLPGYAAGVGVATTGTTRVVGSIDASGAINTTTTLAATAFGGSNVRGAASFDGNQFWVGGTASGAGNLGGVWYVTLGAMAGGAQILAAPSNARDPNIFGGQLYISSASAPFVGVSTVGTNLPTTSPQTATLVLGTTNPTAYALVGGVFYVADSTLQRWTFSGGAWTRDLAFNPIATTCLGVTGWTTAAGAAVLIANTATTVTRVDVTATGTVGTTTTLLTNTTNTAFRRVALSPH